MKTHLKRKNYYLDEKKIRRVRTILGAKRSFPMYVWKPRGNARQAGAPRTALR